MMVAADKRYLDSITTYMMKLGAEHLPPGYDGPVDRKVAAAPHVALLRRGREPVAGWLAASPDDGRSGQALSRQHHDLHDEARRGAPAAWLQRSGRSQGRGGASRGAAAAGEGAGRGMAGGFSG